MYGITERQPCLSACVVYMPTPMNKELYEKVKAEIVKQIPKHSAYRSGLIVQEYMRRGGKYSGAKPVNKGLDRWFKEEWKHQDGKVGYQKKGDIYRQTKRITRDTPTAIHELTPSQIQKARREKKETGHVNKFAK